MLGAAAQWLADLLVRQPAAWFWDCCVRPPHVGFRHGPPMWLRPAGAGRALGPLGALATLPAGDLLFPLLTMTVYGEILTWHQHCYIDQLLWCP
jgi:hypothetical protein